MNFYFRHSRNRFSSLSPIDIFKAVSFPAKFSRGCPKANHNGRYAAVVGWSIWTTLWCGYHGNQRITNGLSVCKWVAVIGDTRYIHRRSTTTPLCNDSIRDCAWNAHLSNRQKKCLGMQHSFKPSETTVYYYLRNLLMVRTRRLLKRIVEGNNKYGKRGKRRCLHCRKWRQGVTHMLHHGIQLIC